LGTGKGETSKTRKGRAQIQDALTLKQAPRNGSNDGKRRFAGKEKALMRKKMEGKLVRLALTVGGVTEDRNTGG